MNCMNHDGTNLIELLNPTLFQRAWMEGKQAEADFDRWISTRNHKKRAVGKIAISWFTKDGKYRAALLGVKEVIAEANTDGNAVVTTQHEGGDTEVTIDFAPRKPGQTWNEKHVRFECFMTAFGRGRIDGDGWVNVVVPNRMKDEALAYLRDNGFSYVTAGKSVG